MQASLQNKYEREKRELEQSNAKIVKQMEAKIYDLETANRVRQILYVKSFCFWTFPILWYFKYPLISPNGCHPYFYISGSYGYKI